MKPVTDNFLDPKNCNKKKCKSCIFRTDGKQVKLSLARELEIRTYLATGQSSHICHQTNKTCYGGLEFQAMIFYRTGRIKEDSVNCLLETAKKYIDEYNKSTSYKNED